jgi:thiosulfate/3-mercaptopyruvate sulfurtransferase
MNMKFKAIVPVDEVALNLDNPDWIIIDCRFSLQDKNRGLREYLKEHIFGAFFADLEKDLSGEIIPGQTGRHPLPKLEDFLSVLCNWGVSNQSQVVVYDDAGGAIAARLWWMFKWIGHESVAILDGGWQAWLQTGMPTKNGHEFPRKASFECNLNNALEASIGKVDDWRKSSDHIIVDARERERYLGQTEPIDPVAGRIPGSVSIPYRENLDEEGFFKNSQELRTIYEERLGNVRPENVICYCGSGVTAALNLAGLCYAGLDGAQLYVGSWSEWITDPERPIEAG